MTISPKLLALAGLLSLSGVVHATVTLQFSQTGVARATGFADHNSNITNNMRWGIIVDGSGNGFQGGSYDVFNNTADGFLSVNSVATDDFFVTSGLLTSTQTATGTDPGGSGGIAAMGSIFATYPSGVGSGDAFRIVWFEGNNAATAAGSFYGMFSDASFTLPADGNTLSYASVFAGATADPAKPASLQFAAAAPEPSRALLIGLGVLGLVVRRRRCI